MMSTPASLLVAISAASALADEKRDDADGSAQATATSWLALVDAGDYAAAWDRAAALLQKAVTQYARVKQAGAARAPLGKLASRKLRSRTATEHLPGQPDGKYVVLEYDTVFERRASATVTTALDPDGTWRVAGYLVRRADLRIVP